MAELAKWLLVVLASAMAEPVLRASRLKCDLCAHAMALAKVTADIGLAKADLASIALRRRLRCC